MEHTIRVTTTGSNGSATGTGETLENVFGFIESIRVNYHASAPNTTTVDVDEVGGAARKVLDLAGSNTDVTLNPRIQLHEVDGSAVTDKIGRVYISGRKLLCTVAASNALTDAVVLTIVVSPD